MKLITSCEAVTFLSQAAPKPWVQRLLRWMAFDEGLAAYSQKGKVQPYGTVGDFTRELVQRVGQLNGPEMDAAIRREFDSETAEMLVGREFHDRVPDTPITWDETEEPRRLDIGFLLFASEIDWNAGILRAAYLPYDDDLSETFFPDSEFFGSEFEKPEFEAEIEGLSFEFGAIELLLPSMELGQTIGFTATQHERGRPVGRPQKWDWEGAMAYVISLAQHPDGLPTGHGAQARIEAMIAGWFVHEMQEAPSPSQVRLRASKIMQMLEMPEKR